MDMSKLPRLSESPAPPPQPAIPVVQGSTPHAIQPMGIEYTLIAAGIGIILMLFLSGPVNILTLLTNPSALPGVYDTDGTLIPYSKSAIIWADLGIFVLCVALIVDGLLNGLTRWKWARFLTAGLAIGCALLNLYVCAALRDKIGMQMFNALAILASLLMLVSSVRQLTTSRANPAT